MLHPSRLKNRRQAPQQRWVGAEPFRCDNGLELPDRSAVRADSKCGQKVTKHLWNCGCRRRGLRVVQLRLGYEAKCSTRSMRNGRCRVLFWSTTRCLSSQRNTVTASRQRRLKDLLLVRCLLVGCLLLVSQQAAVYAICDDG